MTRTGRIGFWVAALLLIGAVGASADHVILNNGTKIEGTNIRRKLDGSVTMDIPGKGRQEFPKGSYKMAVADPTPEFVAAIQQYREKKYDAAIAAAEKVADEKSGCELDKQARYVAARCFVAQSKAGDAVGQFDKLVRIYGDQVLKEPVVAVEYANALLAAKQNTKLVGVLDDIIKDAPRNYAAKAQTMRGEMREQMGQLDSALQDYMRTVIFFQQEEEAVPEALYRAAKVLESKRDPRSKTLYKKLVDDYKDNPAAKDYLAEAAKKS